MSFSPARGALLVNLALQAALQAQLGASWAALERNLALQVALYCQNAFQLGLQVPSAGCPGTLKIELPCRRRAHLSKTALQVYVKLTWTPLGLNLGSLGRLLGSTWDLLEPFGLNLGPLGCLFDLT